MNFLKALFGGKTESAEERRQERNEKDFQVLKYDGVRAMKLNQLEYAVRCFDNALRIKDDLEIRDYLSLVFIQINEPLKAYEQLEILSQAEPQNQQILLRMANVAYDMENYGAMADCCEKALLIDNTNAVVHYLYSRACLGQDDEVNAVAMLTKAITLKEDYYDAYLLRGETHLNMGNMDEANEDANALLEHLPEHEDVLLFKARVDMVGKKYNDALTYYNRVIEVNPFNSTAFKERADVKDELGDPQGAEEDRMQEKEIVFGFSGADDGQGMNIKEKVQEAYDKNNPFK